MQKIRIAQYGTKHGHAAGKLLALRRNPRVDLAGIFEPDLARRRELERAGEPYQGLRWFDEARELLEDPTIVAVASEGRNDESLDQTEQIVSAGKHVWYDKPAGTNWAQWQRVVALAQQRALIIQMGYMFRYHAGFRRIAEWVQSGLLGQVFSIRAHMSTWLSEPEQRVIAVHPGGICYDLAGHMLDQIVWLLGRPLEVAAFLRTDSTTVQGFKDNTLVVCSYANALAFVDIAAIEAPPPARRFEVYGDRGSAIMEPFEPAGALRLCLSQARGEYQAGEQRIAVQDHSRQELYELELQAFLAAIGGERPPDRPASHDLLVQETLLRATNGTKD
ncbi:MAG TPA: Gfo/Idh/MocA family oxidoreductase [Roseiflexaceae bacterium]|nr:Gfo/Idh/MocA family oxidoreductase [Roseiflexaceae bacterium]